MGHNFNTDEENGLKNAVTQERGVPKYEATSIELRNPPEASDSLKSDHVPAAAEPKESLERHAEGDEEEVIAVSTDGGPEKDTDEHSETKERHDLECKKIHPREQESNALRPRLPMPYVHAVVPYVTPRVPWLPHYRRPIDHYNHAIVTPFAFRPSVYNPLAAPQRPFTYNALPHYSQTRHVFWQNNSPAYYFPRLMHHFVPYYREASIRPHYAPVRVNSGETVNAIQGVPHPSDEAHKMGGKRCECPNQIKIQNNESEVKAEDMSLQGYVNDTAKIKNMASP
ncbi:uncharacterized protein LOC124156211 isoform X2 [Ischnura elegans]|uniref:uncharacterized protein LOC124156211 isoform X2 n=1 Tax=Ischnura elegans TaxID=197161 RepID=UPI001ED88E21|nr:uncharacterized protein LOC124156211 isoform X2 [Ischnura elegans]XP_046386561.1 uncharacterized protein LOC124156211 isoform X2 [Ischnura elegans]